MQRINYVKSSWSSTLDLFNIDSRLESRIFETIAHKALQNGVNDFPVRKLNDANVNVTKNLLLKDNIKNMLKSALKDANELLKAENIAENDVFNNAAH